MADVGFGVKGAEHFGSEINVCFRLLFGGDLHHDHRKSYNTDEC